jgi:hypothetical protein
MPTPNLEENEKPKRGRPRGSGNKKPREGNIGALKHWHHEPPKEQRCGNHLKRQEEEVAMESKVWVARNHEGLRSGDKIYAELREVGVLNDRDVKTEHKQDPVKKRSGDVDPGSLSAGDTMAVNFEILQGFTKMSEEVERKKSLLLEINKAMEEEKKTTNCVNILNILNTEAFRLKQSVNHSVVDEQRMLYILDTAHIVEEYRQILLRPVVNTFSKQKYLDDRLEALHARRENYLRFAKAARDYASFEIPAVKDERVLHCEKMDEMEGSTCKSCGLTNSFRFEDDFGALRTCQGCFSVEKIMTLTTSCSDMERVSISGSRQTSDRRFVFRECINQYQGKQTCEIPNTVYENIRSECVKLGFIDSSLPNAFQCVTRDHIVMVLRDFGHMKHVENVNLIYSVITGNTLDDISHLENVLSRDYNILMATHAVKVQQGVMKRRCLTTPDAIYKILRKLGHSCLRSDFMYLRGGSSQNNDDVTEELFRELGWCHIT